MNFFPPFLRSNMDRIWGFESVVSADNIVTMFFYQVPMTETNFGSYHEHCFSIDIPTFISHLNIHDGDVSMPKASIWRNSFYLKRSSWTICFSSKPPIDIHTSFQSFTMIIPSYLRRQYGPETLWLVLVPAQLPHLESWSPIAPWLFVLRFQVLHNAWMIENGSVPVVIASFLVQRSCSFALLANDNVVSDESELALGLLAHNVEPRRGGASERRVRRDRSWIGNLSSKYCKTAGLKRVLFPAFWTFSFAWKSRKGPESIAQHVWDIQKPQ